MTATAGSDGVFAGGGDVCAIVRQNPDQDTGLGLFQSPAVGLLGSVMSPAERCQIALACASAPVMGQGVVVIAAVGESAAAGEAAGFLPHLDQVMQCAGDPVAGGLAGVGAVPGFDPGDLELA